MRYRPSVIALGLTAVTLLVAGTLTWRMTVPSQTCPGVPNGALGALCEQPIVSGPTRHRRIHPLRAELLWVAGAVTALAAVIIEVRRRRPLDGTSDRPYPA